jgi:uncharacterized FlaG/YvyC family protein
MEVRHIPLTFENRVPLPKEEPPARPSASPEEKAAPSENQNGRSPVTERVEATLGSADIHEMAEHIAEVINEAMRALDFSLNFEPDFEEGQVTIRVMDGEGNLIRRIPLSEFHALQSKLSAGNLDGGFLTHKVVP